LTSWPLFAEDEVLKYAPRIVMFGDSLLEAGAAIVAAACHRWMRL